MKPIISNNFPGVEGVTTITAFLPEMARRISVADILHIRDTTGNQTIEGEFDGTSVTLRKKLSVTTRAGAKSAAAALKIAIKRRLGN